MKKVIEFKIGNKCNQNCIHCIMGDKKKELNDLSTKSVFLLIDKFSYFDEIVITSGEPTIRKDFFKIIDYAYKKGTMMVTIHTNGRMFCYENFIKKLNKIGKIKCLVALPADNPKDFKKITQADGFTQLTKGIKNLIENNHIVISNTVINKINYKRLSLIVEKAASLGVKNIQLCAIQAEGNAKTNGKNIVLKISDAAKELKKAISYGISNNVNVKFIGFPFCLINEFIKNSLDLVYKAAEFADIGEKQKNNPDLLKKLNRIKSKKCSICRYNKICIGLPKEYARLYGASELIPVKGKKINTINELKEELGIAGEVIK